MATTEKPVMVVGIDESEHSMYALEWSLDHFFAPCAPNFPFNLVVVHAKPTATSTIGFAGPGAAEVLRYVDVDLKKIGARVLEKAKEICCSKSVNDVILEVVEGDARNVLCDAVEKHHASMLVVGSHGYGAVKRNTAMAGSEDTDADGRDETTCSICLDLVSDEGDREQCNAQIVVTLRRVDGYMQVALHVHFQNLVWTSDEDPYELSYSEMENVLAADNSLHRHHPVFAEHIAYFEPIPLASSNTIESVENPNFNHNWNGISHNEILTAHGLPATDVHHQSWGHHSRPFSSNSGNINSDDQASVRPATLRPTGGPYDSTTRSISSAHPFLYGRGNSQTHTPASHAIHHQHRPINPPGTPSPPIPGVRSFNDPRGRFVNFLPPGSSARNLHQTENSSLNRVQVRERNHFSHIPVMSVDRFHHGGGGSDSIYRSGSFRHRHHQS
ncbi:adenine nucleotide alpha hydrolases-like superfamily protein [Actinidia rufa]|uniref:Adenine nucleotide alpha hydrolases-like superfamily protein n=1 Tax=Actinidia rufa TaxID=165716 RepID=A0A7J0DPM7_9ERIC|nr:adenine nucleotide alpha hydrolases-like superfamily protein [Actinidia rufa]